MVHCGGACKWHGCCGKARAIEVLGTGGLVAVDRGRGDLLVLQLAAERIRTALGLREDEDLLVVPRGPSAAMAGGRNNAMWNLAEA